MERSCAYPVLDLFAAYRLICEQLADTRRGDLPIGRNEIAERLGYSTGNGGMAARKIAALVHYGLLERYKEGRYGVSALGEQLKVLRSDDSLEFRTAIQAALQNPALFARILDRYRSDGRVPSDLAEVLSLEFGITRQASAEAAEVFLRSARFAEVLDADGTLLTTRLNPALGAPKPIGSHKRLELLLTNWKSAWLEIPADLNPQDLEVLEEGLGSLLPKLRAYLGLSEAEVRTFRKRSTPLQLSKP